jgi:Mrp family chromosome partitioning ATPase/uncharacterized protein involved in exopolysaccharide biosynthesis
MFSAPANSFSLILETLWKTFVIYKGHAGFFFVVFLGLFVSQSFLHPIFKSEALILLKPQKDPARIQETFLDTTQNETFTSTQVSLLQSKGFAAHILEQIYHTVPTPQEIKKFQRQLYIKRFPFNNFLSLKLLWKDKKKCPLLLDTLIQHYEAWHLDNTFSQAAQINQLLEKELQTRKKDLRMAEEVLENFLKKNTLSSVFKELYDQKIKQFLDDQKWLLQTRIKKTTLESELQSLNEILKKEKGQNIENLVNQDQIMLIQTALQKAQIELIELRSLFTENSSEVKKQKIKVAYLEEELKKNLKGLLLHDLETSKRKIHDLEIRYIEMVLEHLSATSHLKFLEKLHGENQKKIKWFNTMHMEENRLRRVLQIQEQAYLDLFKKKEENLIFLAKDCAPPFRLLEEPSIPIQTNPIWKMSLFGLIGGVLWNVLMLYLLSFWSKTFPHGFALMQSTGKPILSKIPALHSTQGMLPMITDHPGPFFESFRRLATHLLFHFPKMPLVIQVTSPTKRSGKSIATLNLALTLAQGKGDVLLIECDHKSQPLQRQLFKKEQEPSHENDWEKNVQSTLFPHLFLSCIRVFEESPLEILHEDKLTLILESMKKKYRYILFDSLSIKEHTYPVVLSRMTDLTILVVQWKHESRQNILDAFQMLQHPQISVAGWILNDHELNT